MDTTSDVLVIGGGLIGLAVARAAARAGFSVRLLEKGQPGREASEAAAGMLAPQSEADVSDPLLPLCLRSRDLYPDFAAAVRQESGVDPCLDRTASLVVASGPERGAALDLRARFQRDRGLAVERVRGAALRALEPGLAPELDEGLLLPRDWSVDNVLLTRGVAASAAAAGAWIHPDTPVARLRIEAGRVLGAITPRGRFDAGAVVVAAGAWAGAIAGEGAPPLPIRPVRGQILCCGPHPGGPRRVVVGDGGYLVPRRDGRILVGSTMEEAGFEKAVTVAALAALAAAATAILPGLRQAPFHSAWSGLRPATPDGLPAIGRGAVRGLLHAGGHLRNGILLAPITAEIIVRLLRDEDPGVDLAPFDPLRLDAAAPGASTL